MTHASHRYLPIICLLCALPAPAPAATPLHNPFAQLGNSGGSSALTATASTLQLRGIITGSRGSAANINGTILAVGETFLGYTLLSADEHGAELLGPAGPISLQLPQKGHTNNAR